jgi:antiviral helicase SKI2
MDAAGVRRSNPTANEYVKNELIDTYKSLGILNEIDWSKVRDMSFNEDRLAKRVALDTIATSHCLECPAFLEHVSPTISRCSLKYAAFHEEYLVRQKIEELRNMMSDQNLELLPDYEQRIDVLRELGFIDENGNVELKGRVACEVRSLQKTF